MNANFCIIIFSSSKSKYSDTHNNLGSGNRLYKLFYIVLKISHINLCNRHIAKYFFTVQQTFWIFATTSSCCTPQPFFKPQKPNDIYTAVRVAHPLHPLPQHVRPTCPAVTYQLASLKTNLYLLNPARGRRPRIPPPHTPDARCKGRPPLARKLIYNELSMVIRVHFALVLFANRSTPAFGFPQSSRVLLIFFHSF